MSTAAVHKAPVASMTKPAVGGEMNKAAPAINSTSSMMEKINNLSSSLKGMTSKGGSRKKRHTMSSSSMGGSRKKRGGVRGNIMGSYSRRGGSATKTYQPSTSTSSLYSSSSSSTMMGGRRRRRRSHRRRSHRKRH